MIVLITEVSPTCINNNFHTALSFLTNTYPILCSKIGAGEFRLTSHDFDTIMKSSPTIHPFCHILIGITG